MSQDTRVRREGTWSTVPLSEVATVNPGRSTPQQPDDAPTAFVPMSAISETLGLVQSYAMRPFGEIAKGYTYFEEGDLLFAKITPCMQNGKHAIVRNIPGGFGFGSTEFHVIRVSDRLDPDYLWYFLRQPVILSDAATHFQGAVGQQRVPPSYLKNLTIPLPVVPVQRRIVAKLDKQMTILASAQAALAAQREAATTLRSVVLRAALDPATHPDWQHAKLGDVCSFEYGTSLPAHERRAGPFPVVGSSGVVGSHLEALVRGPTIVVGRKGSVGKITWVDRDCWPIDTTYFVRVRQGTEVSERFLCLFLELLDLARLNQQGAVPGLNRDDAYRLPIALPSLQRQETVTAYVDGTADQVATLMTALDARAATLDLLRTSLLDDAFGGQIRHD